jgi:leader peptidase (prepilin peptidase)/N-methyltransferase
MNDHINYILINVIVIVFGMMLGSFLSLVSYRLPNETDIIFKRSHCPKCNHNLSVIDLFPIFSWALALGKCRYCKVNISFRYPLIELTTLLITEYIYVNYGITLMGSIYLVISLLLLIMIITDFEHYIIPDSIQISLAIIAVVRALLINARFIDFLTGALIGGAIGLAMKYGFQFIRNKDGLGMGDVKFMAIAGLYLGITPLSTFFFISGIVGVITAMIWRALKKGAIFPFGPALAISMAFCLLKPEIELMFSDSVYSLASIFIKH